MPGDERLDLADSLSEAEIVTQGLPDKVRQIEHADRLLPELKPAGEAVHHQRY